MGKKGNLEVPASDRVFDVLGNNDYNDVDLISELIDNAVAARVNDQEIHIQIEIGLSNENPDESYFSIRDDASGIAHSSLPNAISPAGTTSESDHPLNEHGLGMKQAISAAGELAYLKTKHTDEDSATVIEEFSYGEIPHETEDVDWDHGTEIRIRDLNEILQESAQVYDCRIKSYLGARYRRLIGKPEDNLKIEIKHKNLDKGETRKINPDDVRPIYFHPSTRVNDPVVHKEIFEGTEGDGWKVKLTFGYAPEDDAEYESLGINPPKNYEPYYRGLSNQGLDLIQHDRVIQFHQLEEINIVNTTHPQYNRIRGEIDLIDGFSTAITKNRIIGGTEFEAMLNKIRDFLHSNDYLEEESIPGQIPEPCLRDRLSNLLEKPPYSCKDVETEYVVGGLEGFIDILSDGEAWELKVNQASGLDVYQLFAYMDMGNIDKGHLVADGITTGASEAIKHIEDNHGKTIESVDRFDLAINQSMTDKELAKYV
ncbi:ATP-binding protein [Haloarcula amylovorans]|uniref:ATP-binding protein n=1 Tax=Haloarcula amylovorans TaxID=2562280 RepID=UPI001431E03A|nr:ATP-binding protein [Halomicroarcula amylolytica]